VVASTSSYFSQNKIQLRKILQLKTYVPYMHSWALISHNLYTTIVVCAMGLQGYEDLIWIGNSNVADAMVPAW
jgi:hypothetical protein